MRCITGSRGAGVPETGTVKGPIRVALNKVRVGRWASIRWPALTLACIAA